MRLLEAKKIENQNLKEAIKKMPRFFETPTFTDGQDYLGKYGIFIPEKKKLPQGYLKLWPQDFIVEEIFLDGELQTIFPDKFMHKQKDFLPEDPIIYATLVKCGLSTIEAAEELVRMLGLVPKKVPVKSPRQTDRAPQYIKFAGVKDKHAITSQVISIREGNVEKLHDILSPNFFIKNIFSGAKELYLGALRQNQFTIFIRTGRDFKKEEFLKRLAEIEKNGFYNFYYLQRFGIPRMVAHQCGINILKGDYENTLKIALCKSSERDRLYFQSLRREIEGLWGDWEEIKGILEHFPLTFQNELLAIDYLIHNPSDFAGALNEIPSQTWLWIDSFASLLFNNLLSLYIKKGEKLPESLPILSFDERSWSLYKDFLNQAGAFSLTFALKNLQPFPFALRKGGRKTRKTIERIEMLNKKVIPEGVILNFNLPKGCYATTFLSHLLNLVSGALPKGFSNLPIDTKANLKQPSLEEILNKFSDVVSSPSWRYLWRIY